MTRWLQASQASFPNYQQLVPRACCRSHGHSTHIGGQSPPSSSSSLSSSSPWSPIDGQGHHYKRHTSKLKRTTKTRLKGQRYFTTDHPPPQLELLVTSSSPPVYQPPASPVDKTFCTLSYSPDLIFIYGCYAPLTQFLSNSINLLSVLGFCVLSFLKVCFAFILRYEIKEMISKIRLIRGGNFEWGTAQTTVGLAGAGASSSPLHELECYLPRTSIPAEGVAVGGFVPGSMCASAGQRPATLMGSGGVTGGQKVNMLNKTVIGSSTSGMGDFSHTKKASLV